MKQTVWLDNIQQAVGYLKRHLWLSAGLLGVLMLMTAGGVAANAVLNPNPGMYVAAATYLSQSGQPQAYVTSWRLNMRQGPGVEYAVIVKLQNGQVLDLLGRNGDGSWVKVRVPGGYEGWVYAPYTQPNVPVVNLPVLKKTTAVAPGADSNYQHMVYVTSWRLNVRQGPGTYFDILTKLQNGQSVTVLGYNEDNSWLLVRLADGTEGWIWREYTSTQPPVTTLPLTYPPHYVPQIEQPQGYLYLVQVTVRRLNLRYGPGTDYNIITTLNNGEQVKVLGESADRLWLLVHAAEGYEGWVWREYTQVVSTAAAAPIVVAQPQPSVNQYAAGAIAIAEISYLGDPNRAESNEYALVTNRGTAVANLAAWRLNAGQPGQDFLLPNFDLQPGQSCRVYTNAVATDGCGFNFELPWGIWDNGGDCGYLYDATNTQVASFCYSGSEYTNDVQIAPALPGNVVVQLACDPSYPDICIPPAPPDLSCTNIPYRLFRVFPPDGHSFDADHDGVGCEVNE